MRKRSQPPNGLVTPCCHSSNHGHPGSFMRRLRAPTCNIGAINQISNERYDRQLVAYRSFTMKYDSVGPTTTISCICHQIRHWRMLKYHQLTLLAAVSALIGRRTDRCHLSSSKNNEWRQITNIRLKRQWNDNNNNWCDYEKSRRLKEIESHWMNGLSAAPPWGGPKKKNTFRRNAWIWGGFRLLLLTATSKLSIRFAVRSSVRNESDP